MVVVELLRRSFLRPLLVHPGTDDDKLCLILCLGGAGPLFHDAERDSRDDWRNYRSNGFILIQQVFIW